MTDCERDNSPYTHTTSDDTNTPLSLQIPSTKIYFSCRDINLKADRARHSTSKFVFVPAFHSRSRSASGRVSGSLSLNLPDSSPSRPLSQAIYYLSLFSRLPLRSTTQPSNHLLKLTPTTTDTLSLPPADTPPQSTEFTIKSNILSNIDPKTHKPPSWRRRS
jgi:hypothetical protein